MESTCPPRRVLFIDDDPSVRQTLAYLLRKAGHAVAEAASGRAGIELFRENPTDIVFTDFGMPGLSGWDVARAVKALDPRVPVVYVTGAAHAIAPHQQAAVDAIIEKPCRLTTLQTTIRMFTVTAGDMPHAGPTAAAA
jgi:CheY-like chemotaxis protein